LLVLFAARTNTIFLAVLEASAFELIAESFMGFLRWLWGLIHDSSHSVSAVDMFGLGYVSFQVVNATYQLCLKEKKKKKRRRPVEIHSLHLLCHSPPDKEGGDWGGFNPAHLCGPEWKSTHIEGEGGDRHIHIEVV